MPDAATSEFILRHAFPWSSARARLSLLQVQSSDKRLNLNMASALQGADAFCSRHKEPKHLYREQYYCIFTNINL